MAQKVITVKLKGVMEQGKLIEEFEPDELNKLLADDWIITDMQQTTTQANVGFLYLTYTLSK